MPLYRPPTDLTTRMANGDIPTVGRVPRVFIETAPPSNLTLELAGIFNESRQVIPLQTDIIRAGVEGELSKVEVTTSTPYETTTETVIVIDTGGTLVPISSQQDEPVPETVETQAVYEPTVQGVGGQSVRGQKDYLPQPAPSETSDTTATTDAATATETETAPEIFEPSPAEVDDNVDDWWVLSD